VVAPPVAPVLPELDEPVAEPPPKQWVKTAPNAHGLYKIYPNRPTHDPDQSVCLDNLCVASDLLVPPPDTPSSSPTTPPYSPFLNASIARLMCWFYSGSTQKSTAELDSLVNEVLLHEDFSLNHLQGFSAIRENKRLDDTATALPGEPPSGWISGSVKIKLPAPKVCVAEKDAVEFEVPGIIYRPLLDVMIEAFQSPAFKDFHITPFESRWDRNHTASNEEVATTATDEVLDENGFPQLPAGHEVIYQEIYTSARMMAEHRALPHDPTQPNIETIIAAYMFWSDSTHLANFGDASLWPLYTFFGNLSKYIRAKPTSNAGHHQAYFPSVRLYYFA
jgi:hypothetical protein